MKLKLNKLQMKIVWDITKQGMKKEEIQAVKKLNEEEFIKAFEKNKKSKMFDPETIKGLYHYIKEHDK